MTTTPVRGPDRETLAEALRRAATDLASAEPPPALRRAVLAAQLPTALAARVPSLAAPHRDVAGRPGRWWAATGVALATLVLSAALLLWPPPGRPPAAIDTRAFGGFMPVASADRWPAAGAAAAPAWLVATELPRERLAGFGLPFDPARAGETVSAELLLRGNGEVLAVRMLHTGADRSTIVQGTLP